MKLPVAILAGLLGTATTAMVAIDAGDARATESHDDARATEPRGEARRAVVTLAADGGAPPPPKPIDDCPPCGRG